MQGYLRVLGIVVASPHSEELAAGRGSGFFLLHLQFDLPLCACGDWPLTCQLDPPNPGSPLVFCGMSVCTVPVMPGYKHNESFVTVWIRTWHAVRHPCCEPIAEGVGLQAQRVARYSLGTHLARCPASMLRANSRGCGAASTMSRSTR